MNLNNWERKVLLDALDIAYEDEDVPIFNDGDVHATQSRFSSLKEKLQDETPYVDQLKRIADSLEQLTSPPTDPRIKALEWNGRVHDLKTWPEPFAAIRADLKPWEFRLNDRDYQVGDKLRLREWSPTDEAYTGEVEERLVPWVLRGGQFGVPKDFAIMSLARAALTQGADQAATKGDDHG